jgi:hypothetical protein
LFQTRLVLALVVFNKLEESSLDTFFASDCMPNDATENSLLLAPEMAMRV